jgi:hypothetical protein
MSEIELAGDLEEKLPQGKYGAVPTRDVPHANSNKKSMFTDRTGKNLKWSQVDFVINKKIPILASCWGNVNYGRVCAVMGPSGE